MYCLISIMLWNSTTEADLFGFNPELEELKLEETSDREDRNISSEASLSDTSDPDQANDIDELLQPGYPIYFNFAIPKKTHPVKVSQSP